MQILEQQGRWEVIDHLMLANGGKHPTTYGDMKLDEKGQLVPKEVVLTDKEDYGSLQSLDYIFEFRKSKASNTG